MPEIRRTIMNTFKDAQECQMFVMILKQKWSEFDGKLKDKFTVEIATDVADASKHTAYLTAQSVEDFKIVEDYSSGISSVIFSGITSTNGNLIVVDNDPNQNQLPRGGQIISIGSSGGLGIAPLAGAAVTAVIGAGTVSYTHLTLPTKRIV